MQRGHPSSPRKPFINAYHVNEVPLPYYDPLADPYLQGFFSSQQPRERLSHMGLKFQPQKQYNYQQRRLTNHNKFLRSNSHYIPHKHIQNNSLLLERDSSTGRKSAYQGYLDNEEEIPTTKSMFILAKHTRRPESDLLRLSNQTDYQLRLAHQKDLSQSPSTHTSSKRGNHLIDGQHRRIFRSNNFQRNAMSNSSDLIL